jgi:RNA polymerase sigma-70 factor (ECF subfamily)
MLTWPALDRQIFRLCTNNGLTYKEAAARLGVTPGVIRNQLSRSRKALRVSLSSVGWLPDPQETKR